MKGILIIAILVGLVAGPLWLVGERIQQRAKTAHVSAMPALLLALGGWMAGVVATNYVAFSLWDQIGIQSGWVIFPTLCWCNAIGATAGAAAGFVYLWARTARDPDFGRINDPNNCG
jgi:hypothetical protein